jgi:Pyruvate/2-oxoacid:ferredoxin oxidoreductase gamma subunit
MEILIIGTGGQGVKILGEILAGALTYNKHVWVFCYSSYTPASRGGLVLSEIVITDKREQYPHIEQADLVLVLPSEEAKTFLSSSSFKNKSKSETKIIRVPMIESGLPVNLLGLGMLEKYLPQIPDQNIMRVLRRKFDQKKFEINKKAFQKGRSINQE